METEKLRGLLGTLEKPSSASSLALSGNPYSFVGFNVLNKPFLDSWIIDFGATDHMTHSSCKFSTYAPSTSNRKISIAEDSLTTVAGLGDIKITPSFILKNVLHVPKLSTNLISIKILTKDLNCKAIFCSSYCEFQDQGSGGWLDLQKKRMCCTT